MELTERFTQEIIKILHNSKNSILRDVSKWKEENTRSDDHVMAVEGPQDDFMYEARKKHEQDENPSIFGNQPVSEYAQQPVPENLHDGDFMEGIDESEEHLDEDEEEESHLTNDPFPEHQLAKDQREALATERRKQEIERHRSNFDGMPRTQR